MPRTKKAAVESIAEAVSETAEAAAVVPEEKKAEPKKTTRKRTVKAAAENAEAAPKKRGGRKKAAEADPKVQAEEVKKEEPKKAAPKKTAARKTAARKAAEQVSVKIQFGGKDISAEEILEKAKAAFAAAHEGVEIKTIDLYVNADDHAAYYVVNGEEPENNKIDL